MPDLDLGIRYVGGDEEAGRVFIVETRAEAGWELGSHLHRHAHTSVLVSGAADVTVAGITRRYEGYNLITVPANTTHQVRAITDIVWLCLWAAELAPRDEVEQSLKLQRQSACGGCPGGCEPQTTGDTNTKPTQGE